MLGVMVQAPTVLYVEDDKENWEVARLNLRRRFNLAWASSDQEACEYIRLHGEELSAILMDIELKGSRLSGVELTELLRKGSLRAEVPAYAQGLPRLKLDL